MKRISSLRAGKAHSVSWADKAYDIVAAIVALPLTATLANVLLTLPAVIDASPVTITAAELEQLVEVESAQEEQVLPEPETQTEPPQEVVQEVPPASTEEMVAAPQNEIAELPEFVDSSEGQMIGFQGAGSDLNSAEGDETGTASGVRWSFTFANTPDWERWARCQDCRVAFISTGKAGREFAVVDGQGVTAPVSHAEFAGQHAGFSGRYLIRLDRKWEVHFAEGLLPYGGGWEFWLVLSDSCFQRWLRAAQSRMQQQQLTWDHIDMIRATVTMGLDHRLNCELTDFHQTTNSKEP